MLLVTGLRGLREIGVHVSESNPTKRLAHVKRSKGGLEEKLEKVFFLFSTYEVLLTKAL